MSDRSLTRRRKKTTGKRWVAACAAAAVAIAIPALAAPSASAGGQDQTHKVWVCKYVGTPGTDEVLKGGKNPISVDESATDGTGVGGFFNDAQGRSYVVAIDDGSGSPGASACPAPDGGPEVVEDASASVSTVPATCASGEVLEYGGIENASFSGTPDGAEGPGSYNVTATADAGHAFGGGDTTRPFSGSLDGPLSGADCAGPQPDDDTEYRDIEDAPDCSVGTVTIQHQERTRPYTLDGDTWVPGAWSDWTTVGTDTRSATAEECPPPVTKVAIPDMPATLDPCNGAGVTNNVTWAGSLPASNAQITWSEDPDTHVRTATLVGDAEWTDGTTAPRVFFLPGDDGRLCDTPPVSVSAASPSWTDDCGTANDVYTIPSIEGVIYTVNGVVTGPGTYPGSGTMALVATAADRYVLTSPLAFDMVFTDEPCVDQIGTVTAVTTCSGVTFTASGFAPLTSNENGYVWAFMVKANGTQVSGNIPGISWSGTIPKGEGAAVLSFSSPDQSVAQTWTIEVWQWQPWTEAGDVLVASFGPFVQAACATPPVKVDIPAMPGVNDPCNPVGVGNNVTWKDPLPADTDHVKWVEDSLARTASLVGDAVEWTDGTTVPKVYRLPGDNGEVCVVVTTPVTTTSPATTPVTIPPPATTTPAASTPVTTTAANQPPVVTTNQPTAVNPPPADQGAPPAAAAPAAAAVPADAGSSQSDQASSAVSAGAPPPPEAGDVAATSMPVQKSTDTERVRVLAILAVVILAMVAGCWLAPRFGGRR